VLAETPRRRGQFDLPGAITGSAGVAALVYGLSSAATSPDGVSHWGDAKVVASLAAAAVLLAAFAVIEARSRNALLPLRLLRDRNRTGAYLSFGGVGIFVFGMFFFLTPRCPPSRPNRGDRWQTPRHGPGSIRRAGLHRIQAETLYQVINDDA
jgi:hypothetical protein